MPSDPAKSVIIIKQIVGKRLFSGLSSLCIPGGDIERISTLKFGQIVIYVNPMSMGESIRVSR